MKKIIFTWMLTLVTALAVNVPNLVGKQWCTVLNDEDGQGIAVAQEKVLKPVRLTPLPEIDLIRCEQLSFQTTEDYVDYEAMSPEDKALVNLGEEDSVLGHFYSDACSWYCGGHISNVSSSSALSAQYAGKNAHDFSLLNVWAEGAPGQGEGEYLIYTFPGECPRITTVQILNGYTKTEKAWLDNGRVKRLRMYYNGEPYAVLELEDTRRLQSFDVGLLGFHDASAPDWTLKFEILDVYPGDKYADTVITELFFDGIDVH